VCRARNRENLVDRKIKVRSRRLGKGLEWPPEQLTGSVEPKEILTSSRMLIRISIRVVDMLVQRLAQAFTIYIPPEFDLSQVHAGQFPYVTSICPVRSVRTNIQGSGKFVGYSRIRIALGPPRSDFFANEQWLEVSFDAVAPSIAGEYRFYALRELIEWDSKPAHRTRFELDPILVKGEIYPAVLHGTILSAEENVPIKVPALVRALGIAVDPFRPQVSTGRRVEARCYLSSKDHGSYRMRGLAPGTYTIFASKIGYSEFIAAQDFTIIEEAELNVSLPSEPKLPQPSNSEMKAFRRLRVDPRFENKYLIVEGEDDNEFWDSVCLKISGRKLESFYKVVPASANGEQKETVAVLTKLRGPIVVLRDYDNETDRSAFVNQLRDSLARRRETRVKSVDQRSITLENGATVLVVPQGLPGDPDFGQAGITHHCVEDYCLKLLVIDEKVTKWGGVDLIELKQRARVLRDLNLHSSKTIFWALGVLKNMSVVEPFHEVISVCDTENLIRSIGSPLFEIFPNFK
jgi:hypothetical protein